MTPETLYLMLAAVLATGPTTAPVPHVGDLVQISTDREMEEHSNRNGSEGTSTDRDSYVERVVAVRPDGVVLEYDLPVSASSGDRASNWQFPFTVLKANDGKFRLLNGEELTQRVDRWLKTAGMPRAACGKLIFTWNAFRIECDPQSTVRWLATVTLPTTLVAGEPFTDPDARTAVALQRVSGDKLSTTFKVDPEAIRRERAQTDVSVAELSGKVLTLDTALNVHRDEVIMGTVAVTFDLDATGRPWRRTRVRTIRIGWPNGRVDTQMVTETLSRTPIDTKPWRTVVTAREYERKGFR